MNNEAFEKWLSDFMETDEYKNDSFHWRDMAEKTWDACQSASANRIAELEAEVSALNSSFGACDAENSSLRTINSNMSLRIAELENHIELRAQEANTIHVFNRDRITELESDCKAMAAALIFTHVKKYVTHDPGFPPIRDCCCTCPACIIAAKYREWEK